MVPGRMKPKLPLRRTCIALFVAVGLPAADRVEFGEYRVFYDPQPMGRRANTGYVALSGGAMELVFAGPLEDDEAGTLPFVTRTLDLGRTWSAPQPFGVELAGKVVKAAEKEALTLAPFGPTTNGTVLSVGYHVGRGVRKQTMREDMAWRASSLLVGRRGAGQPSFEYQDYPPGTFLEEQFAYPGILAGDRIVLQMWGSGRRGENWQCGVLVSDNDGRSWRYRQVGYEADKGIRDDPGMPAGFNEQTLMRMRDGTLVSIIRGREKLGRVPQSPKDTWFFRSLSRDRGEAWSQPEPTNLAGTGAPPAGLTLPDGSLLMAARVPYSRTLYRLNEAELFGLHFARSFDGGKTWRTEKILQRDPQGNPFDNYYNAMNGQFVPVGRREWMYVFGQFSVQHNLHRMLTVRLRIE
jgi:hypothetical protein